MSLGTTLRELLVAPIAYAGGGPHDKIRVGCAGGWGHSAHHKPAASWTTRSRGTGGNTAGLGPIRAPPRPGPSSPGLLGRSGGRKTSSTTSSRAPPSMTSVTRLPAQHVPASQRRAVGIAASAAAVGALACAAANPGSQLQTPGARAEGFCMGWAASTNRGCTLESPATTSPLLCVVPDTYGHRA